MMQYLVTYGSQYGSTEQYARTFAEKTGFTVMSYSDVKNMIDQDLVIHFGALYAGGVMGLKSIASKLSPDTRLIIVTVGLADVLDSENVENIRKSIRAQITEKRYNQTQIFHLRGAINYEKLNFKHKTMMAMLYAKVKKLPKEQQNAETKALRETYGKEVNFVDNASLNQLFEVVRGKLS